MVCVCVGWGGEGEGGLASVIFSKFTLFMCVCQDNSGWPPLRGGGLGVEKGGGGGFCDLIHIHPVYVCVKTTVAGPFFIVCTVQRVPEQPTVSFHHLSEEDGQLKTLTCTTDMDELASEQVLFRLQAQIPVQVQLDHSKSAGSEWPVAQASFLSC